MSHKIKKLTYKADGKVEIVFFDKSKMSVSDNTVVELKLSSGMELNFEVFRRLELLNGTDKCRKKMFDFLSRRPHGRAELKRKLQRNRDYSIDLIESLLTQAETQGLINDEEFTRLFVEDSKRLRRQDGPGKIRTRLFQKGISREIIDQVLSEFEDDPEEEYEKIKELALKKWKTYRSSVELQKRRARLYRFLTSRGFSSQVVGKVVSEVARQRGEY